MLSTVWGEGAHIYYQQGAWWVGSKKLPQIADRYRRQMHVGFPQYFF